jgi:hypothetical protein
MNDNSFSNAANEPDEQRPLDEHLNGRAFARDHSRAESRVARITRSEDSQ